MPCETQPVTEKKAAPIKGGTSKTALRFKSDCGSRATVSSFRFTILQWNHQFWTSSWKWRLVKGSRNPRNHEEKISRILRQHPQKVDPQLDVDHDHVTGSPSWHREQGRFYPTKGWTSNLYMVAVGSRPLMVYCQPWNFGVHHIFTYFHNAALHR